MTTSVSDIKTKLIAVIERGEADQAALVALLSDADKAAIGEPDHWAVKDQIAHLNFWRDRTLRRLIAVRDGAEPPGPSPDFQPENERNFAAQQHTAVERDHRRIRPAFPRDEAGHSAVD